MAAAVVVAGCTGEPEIPMNTRYKVMTLRTVYYPD
jgi:hypothetical protein